MSLVMEDGDGDDNVRLIKVFIFGGNNYKS